jgi:NAD dependent epimerase/dehydratase
MDLNGARILVTGANGFIGSHLVERLVARGLSVRAFVHYNSFNSWGWLGTAMQDTLSRVEVVAGDVRDAGSVRTAMDGCDVVFHLAALIAIPYSYRAPESYVDTNVRGTLNVVQAAKDLRLQRVVITSTSEVYGTARQVPISEDHPLQAQSPYAATKIAADQLALSFHRSFGTPVSVLRPFNTYGPRQSLRAVIPTVITQLAHGQQTLRLGATEPTRDFTFVIDTADAFISVAECDACVGEVVNSGSGREISIGELAARIGELMNRAVEIERESDRLRPDTSEVYRLLADTRKLQRLATWRLHHPLDEGLRRTIDWFTQAGNLALYDRVHRYHV